MLRAVDRHTASHSPDTLLGSESQLPAILPMSSASRLSSSNAPFLCWAKVQPAGIAWVWPSQPGLGVWGSQHRLARHGPVLPTRPRHLTLVLV